MKNSTVLLWLTLLLFAGFLFYWLTPILTPFLLAALLAYVGDPLVDRLQTRNLSRTSAVITVFSGIIIIFILLVLVIIPAVSGQIDRMSAKLPNYGLWLQQAVLQKIATTFDIAPENINIDSVIAAIRDNIGTSTGILKNLLTKITGSANYILTFISYLVLVPVITFYLLRDWDILVAKISELIPRNYINTVTMLTKRSDLVLAGFLRGQMLVMLALGIIYSIGLSIVGLDMAIIIGMFAGFVSFVPYLGLIVGILLAGLMALMQFQDFIHPIGVAIVFIVAQGLEGMVLTPKFVGDRIGLHPVAVLFAILAGGQLFGFMGILLALPAAAVINVFLGYIKEHYLQSSVYLHNEDNIAYTEDFSETNDNTEIHP
ncbi:MAG: AI-2E family transporter [Cardiobacteriaceae bacterium]|nr:AI-2E family transporter [Cardiobacteriaceae bacterium]